MGCADDLFDLTDRVVLATGGSRGLGREMAFAAAHCGADVVIASRDPATCQVTAREIEAATGRTAMAHCVHAVRVNTLMAGPFDTGAHDWEPDKVAQGVRGHALRRTGRPDEVVGAALYPISDASSYTSGATLRVDGGIP